VNVAREYFGDMLKGALEDTAVEIKHMDGAVYLGQKENEFDVIIVDSSDPADETSPARSLYTDKFFGLCSRALRPGGVVCIQGECPWIPSHLSLVRTALLEMQKHFGVTDYGVINIPTYPCGQIGMILGAKITEADIPSLKDRELFFRKPRRFLDYSVERGPLKYYDEYVHEAAFALPPFVRKALKDVTCSNFIASSDLPEGLPTPEEFHMLFWGMLGAGLVAGSLLGRYVLTRLF
jgi:spermidine synthase